MSSQNKINICQPGFNASCGLCCGSHNYSARPEEIKALFEKRALVWSEKGMSIRHSIEKGDGSIRERDCDLPTLPRLIADATQCPFLALLDRPGGPVIGCLIYPESGCRTCGCRILSTIPAGIFHAMREKRLRMTRSFSRRN
jgi:hypothetical protein